ncbi:MAG: hypothetical protein ACYSSP_05255 [Planctomycetota bacterium]
MPVREGTKEGKSGQRATPASVKDVEGSNLPFVKQISEEKASRLLAVLAE